MPRLAPITCTFLLLCTLLVMALSGLLRSCLRSPASFPSLSPAAIACPAGTFSNATRRYLPCEACPQGTWSSGTGQASNATCRRCPEGTTTAAPGASSRDFCLRLPFACPPGTQPMKAVAISAADCGPLVCGAGLVLSESRTSCEGCPAGTAGTPPNCQPCNSSFEICPGLTSFPLPAPAALLAGLDALVMSGGSTVTPALALVAGSISAVQGASSDSGSDAATSRVVAASPAPLRAQCAALAAAAGPYWRAAAAAVATPVPVGGLIIHKGQASIWGTVGLAALVVLVLGCIAMRAPPVPLPLPAGPASGTQATGDAAASAVAGSKGAAADASGTLAARPRLQPLHTRVAAGVGDRLRRVLMAMDCFSLQHKVERRQSPVREPPPLGGICSLWGILALIGFAAVLILQRAEDNTTRTVAVDTGGDLQLVLARGAARSASNSEGSLSGIHAVVAVVGEPGACAALVSWRASGLYSGTFTHSVRTCGALAVHFFVCPDCVVTIGSALSVLLPWSCQAMLLRSVAVGTDGVVSSRNASAFAPIPQATAASPAASASDGSLGSLGGSDMMADDAIDTGLGADGGNTVDEDPASVTLLSAVESCLTPVLLLQNDTTGEDGKEALTRGYRLLGGHVTRTEQTYTADSFTPATAAVHLTLNLEPSGFYQVRSIRAIM